jgi:hypothetical protein
MEQSLFTFQHIVLLLFVLSKQEHATCLDVSQLSHSSEFDNGLVCLALQFDSDDVCCFMFLLCYSYLKLYTTLPLSKLATFMGPGPSQDENRDLKKEIEALIIHLLCFKHKMKNVVWTKGTSGLEGKFQSGSEVSTEFLMCSCSKTFYDNPYI